MTLSPSCWCAMRMLLIALANWIWVQGVGCPTRRGSGVKEPQTRADGGGQSSSTRTADTAASASLKLASTASMSSSVP